MDTRTWLIFLSKFLFFEILIKDVFKISKLINLEEEISDYNNIHSACSIIMLTALAIVRVKKKG